MILQLQGIFVTKQIYDLFLTLSVKIEHILKDWGFRIPAHFES